MFARSHRFSFKKGAPRKNFNTTLFVIRYDKNVHDNLECAVVVGKKVDKKAVGRNKIRRQLIALVKEILPEDIPLRLVIIAKKPILEASFELKKEELEKAFKSIQIIP